MNDERWRSCSGTVIGVVRDDGLPLAFINHSEGACDDILADDRLFGSGPHPKVTRRVGLVLIGAHREL